MLFKHKYIIAPTVTPADAIVQAAKELEDVIKDKIPTPLAKSDIDRLKECTNIFGLNFTTKEEEENAEPPRVRTKEGKAINHSKPRSKMEQSQKSDTAS